MKLLIAGGAGYIGSHTVKFAQENNHEVTVLDNFSSGHEWSIQDCEVMTVDLLDNNKLTKNLKNKKFDGVIHFAAKSLVGESVLNPKLYYENNVKGSINLLNQMIKNEINNIVFSSSAAIFGNPDVKKISEHQNKNPINPYGKSKLMIENILEDYSKSYGLNVASLRYFNAAGADPFSLIGEAHNPETHLIPNIINSILFNKNDLKIFGNKYNTKDGTCVRDYIHVNDLAEAHLKCFEFFSQSSGFSTFNLGNGQGFSVIDIVKSCEKISKQNITYSISPPREGDPSILVCDNKKALDLLKLKLTYSTIDSIIETAWRWHNTDRALNFYNF